MSVESSEKAIVDRAVAGNLDDIIDRIVDHIAECLDIPADAVDIEVPFVELGLSSVQAVEIAGELEKWLGTELPPTLAYDYPTIEAAATYIFELSKSAGREKP